MANQETEENTSNIEKNPPSDSSKDKAEESSSKEALESFAPGQGKTASSTRENESRSEVAKGSLPGIDLIDEKQTGPGKDNPQGKDHPQGKEHEHEHSGHPEGPGHEHEHRETIDHNASDKFKQQVEQTSQKVLQGMPEHLRTLLKDVPVGAAKSITHNESGDKINGTFGPEGIVLAEERDGNAPLDTILKHEYGHAFDETKDPPYSHDPEFRRRIDEALKNDPELRKHRDEDPEGFYAEIFADLFASNLGSRGRDLAIPHVDRQMASAREWVRQKMMAGARRK